MGKSISTLPDGPYIYKKRRKASGTKYKIEEYDGEIVAKILLNDGKFAIVDIGNVEWLSQMNWSAIRSKRVTIDDVFYVYNSSYPEISMHRLILGAKKGDICDHINGNGLDNRRSNLRIVSERQNTQNRHIQMSSSFPGVSWNKYHNKWQTSIRIGNTRKHLGYFNSEKKAFERYKRAVKELAEETILEEYS